MCKCLIIKLSIKAVTMVTNHNKAYNRHTWVDTNHRLTNHRPERPSQNATAQSGAWEARQGIPECTSPDRLSQSAFLHALNKRGCRSPKFWTSRAPLGRRQENKLSCNKQKTKGQAELLKEKTSGYNKATLHNTSGD